MWALNDTYRRFFPRGTGAEHKNRSPQMYRYDNLIMHGIVCDAVHRAAELGTLAFDYPYRSFVAVCQPGKYQYPGYTHSIRNQNLSSLRVVGNRSRIAKTNRGCSGRSIA